jgi:hypothetical protein
MLGKFCQRYPGVDASLKADFTPAFPPILGRQRAWLLAFWRFDFFTM